MANVAEIAVGVASETSTGVDGGIDVCFDLILPDGTVIKGEVTLLPHEDGRPGYGSWGVPDNWLDGNTLAALRTLDECDFRDTLNHIEGETAPVAKAFAAAR